jgi:hypothetical protein
MVGGSPLAMANGSTESAITNLIPNETRRLAFWFGGKRPDRRVGLSHAVARFAQRR